MAQDFARSAMVALCVLVWWIPGAQGQDPTDPASLSPVVLTINVTSFVSATDPIADSGEAWIMITVACDENAVPPQDAIEVSLSVTADQTWSQHTLDQDTFQVTRTPEQCLDGTPVTVTATMQFSFTREASLGARAVFTAQASAPYASPAAMSWEEFVGEYREQQIVLDTTLYDAEPGEHVTVVARARNTGNGPLALSFDGGLDSSKELTIVVPAAVNLDAFGGEAVVNIDIETPFDASHRKDQFIVDAIFSDPLGGFRVAEIELVGVIETKRERTDEAGGAGLFAVLFVLAGVIGTGRRR